MNDHKPLTGKELEDMKHDCGNVTPGHSEVMVGPVTIGCMDPAARDLLDIAMEQWQAHIASRTMQPDDPAYSFAYWLFRWSGLVHPTASRDLPRCLSEIERLRTVLNDIKELDCICPPGEGCRCLYTACDLAEQALNS